MLTNPRISTALIILLLIPYGSQQDMQFYVITSGSCEGCLARVENLRGLYPDTSIVFYDTRDNVSLRRLSWITEVIEVDYLPLPVFGIFLDGEIRIIAAGGISRESWEDILPDTTYDVRVYVDDGKGQAVLKKYVTDSYRIDSLENLFTEKEVSAPPKRFESLIAPIITVALLDAFNPCMLGVFLVLIAFIAYSVERRMVIRTSLAFSLAVFSTHLALGVLMVRVLNLFTQLRLIIGAATIFLGALQIYEFFKGGGKRIPGALAGRITYLLQRSSNPQTGFVAGVVTATFLMTCSSAPYFLALNLISSEATLTGGLLLILLYKAIAVTPLLTVTALIYFISFRTTGLRLFIFQRRRWMNLLSGVALILLSLFILIY